MQRRQEIPPETIRWAAELLKSPHFQVLKEQIQVDHYIKWLASQETEDREKAHAELRGFFLFEQFVRNLSNGSGKPADQP